MQRVKLFAIALLAGLFLCAAPHSRAAQVRHSVTVGNPPVCPYGYFTYAPYNCAPYGYYGPSWFTNGVFVGAGPWYHGSNHFHGYVNRRFSPRHGYRGPLPKRGTHGHYHPPHHFHGTAQLTGHGKAYYGHEHGHGHAPPENHGHAKGHKHGHAKGNGHGNHDHGNGNGH